MRLRVKAKIHEPSLKADICRGMLARVSRHGSRTASKESSERIYSPLALHKAQARRAYVFLMFCFFKYIFSDFCQTNHVNVCQTDLYEICRIGRTLVVDE